MDKLAVDDRIALELTKSIICAMPQVLNEPKLERSVVDGLTGRAVELFLAVRQELHTNDKFKFI